MELAATDSGAAAAPAGDSGGASPACNARLARRLAQEAHALCSMAEAAAAVVAAEQQSDGDTFNQQAGEEEEEVPAPVGEQGSGEHSGRACADCGSARTTTWRRHPISREWSCNSCYHKASRKLKREQSLQPAAGSGSYSLADSTIAAAAAAVPQGGGGGDKRPRLATPGAAAPAAGAPAPAEQQLAVIDVQHQILMAHVVVLQRQVAELQTAVATLPAAVADAVAARQQAQGR